MADFDTTIYLDATENGIADQDLSHAPGVNVNTLEKTRITRLANKSDNYFPMRLAALGSENEKLLKRLKLIEKTNKELNEKYDRLFVEKLTLIEEYAIDRKNLMEQINQAESTIHKLQDDLSESQRALLKLKEQNGGETLDSPLSTTLESRILAIERVLALALPELKLGTNKIHELQDQINKLSISPLPKSPQTTNQVKIANTSSDPPRVSNSTASNDKSKKGRNNSKTNNNKTNMRNESISSNPGKVNESHSNNSNTNNTNNTNNARDNSKPKNSKVIIVGDSQAREMSGLLASKLPSNKEVFSFLRPGCSMASVVRDLDKIISNEGLALDDHVIVIGGSNDIPYGTLSGEFAAAVDKIVRISCKTNIIIPKIPFRHDLPFKYRSCVNKLNHCLTLKLQNTTAKLVCPKKLYRSHFDEKGLHYSFAGKKALTRCLAAAVKANQTTNRPKVAETAHSISLNISTPPSTGTAEPVANMPTETSTGQPFLFLGDIWSKEL